MKFDLRSAALAFLLLRALDVDAVSCPPPNDPNPTTGWVNCVDGKKAGTDTPCNVACGDACCSGDGACAYANACIKMDGSCNGDHACSNVARYSEGQQQPVISGPSCEGSFSCASLGFSAAAGAVPGFITKSCNAMFACETLGAASDSNSGSFGNLLASCKATNACYGMCQGTTCPGGSLNGSCITTNVCNVKDGIGKNINSPLVCKANSNGDPAPTSQACFVDTSSLTPDGTCDGAGTCCDTFGNCMPKKTQMPSDTPSVIPSDEPSHMPSDEPSDAQSSTPSDILSDVPSDTPTKSPSSIPSLDPSRQPSKSVLPAQIIQATLDMINPTGGKKKKGVKAAKKEPKGVKAVKKALKDAKEAPPNLNGAIKDLAKSAEYFKCDKTPVPAGTKTTCNLIADTITQVANTLHAQNIFVRVNRPPSATKSLAAAETSLQGALIDINAGTPTPESTLTKKVLEDAIEEVVDAQDKFNKQDFSDAIEELTKASDDLDCDNGPGPEPTRQGLCDAILDAIVAVAAKMNYP